MMKTIAGSLAILFLIGTPAAAQIRARVYSRPEPPPSAALDRLNLKLAWRTFVPTDGARDGIFSVKVLDDVILVQLRSGMIVALNPEDGTTRWRTVVGAPYRVTQPLGYNSSSVLVYNGVRLFALDRTTGVQKWDMMPPQSPTAPPAADDEMLYLAQGSKTLEVYQLPKAPPSAAARDQADQAKKPEGAPAVAPDARPAAEKPPAESEDDEAKDAKRLPRLLWDYDVNGRLNQAPLLSGELIVLADSTGTFFGNSKHSRSVQYQFQVDSPLAAPMAQHGGVAYIAARDFNVFALDIEAGRILWRFTSDRSIQRKPVVTDEDLYVAPDTGGLYRVDRLTGTGLWRNSDATRFLAHNKKYVYAGDPRGRLLILDRGRGTLLSSYDVRDFVVPIINESTDRVFLAANDGLIVCLHDRDYPRPLQVTIVERKEPAAPTPDVPAPAADRGDKKPPADKAAGKD
jgi:outer membrane protein assembly factor BamB